jgi:hypothetical protein
MGNRSNQYQVRPNNLTVRNYELSRDNTANRARNGIFVSIGWAALKHSRTIISILEDIGRKIDLGLSNINDAVTGALDWIQDMWEAGAEALTA